jgi:hypothetical protein
MSTLFGIDGKWISSVNRLFIPIVICVLPTTLLSARASDDGGNKGPWARLLEENGIASDAETVLKYLQQASCGPEDIAGLMRQLGATRPAESAAAEKELVSKGAWAVPSLMIAVDSDDPEMRQRARRTLHRIDRHGAPVLTAALNMLRIHRPKDGVRAVLTVAPLCWGAALEATATDVLEEIATPADESVLKEALKNKDIRVRAMALKALAGLAGKEGIHEIRAYLTAPSPPMRLAAAQALADRGDRASLPVLAQLLSHPNGAMRQGSVITLRLLTRKHFDFVAGAPHEERALAAAKWRQWITEHGETAKLHLPAKPEVMSSHLPEGHMLMTLGYTRRVIEVDADGKTVWSYKASWPWSAQKMANGNVLVGDYGGEGVTAVTPNGRIAWRSHRPGAVSVRETSQSPLSD